MLTEFAESANGLLVLALSGILELHPLNARMLRNKAKLRPPKKRQPGPPWAIHGA